MKSWYSKVGIRIGSDWVWIQNSAIRFLFSPEIYPQVLVRINLQFVQKYKKKFSYDSRKRLTFLWFYETEHLTSSLYRGIWNRTWWSGSGYLDRKRIQKETDPDSSELRVPKRGSVSRVPSNLPLESQTPETVFNGKKTINLVHIVVLLCNLLVFGGISLYLIISS